MIGGGNGDDVEDVDVDVDVDVEADIAINNDRLDSFKSQCKILDK